MKVSEKTGAAAPREGYGRNAYIVLMALSAACSFGKGFVFAKLLGSGDFAYYATLDLVAAYGVYAGTWGLLEGLNRELPLLVGSRRVRRARALAAQGGGAIVGLSLLMFILYAPVVWWWADKDAMLRDTLLMCGLYVLANNLFLFGVMWLLASRRSAGYAGVMLAKNALALAAGAAVAPAAGLWGVLGAEIAVTGILALWLVAFKVPPPRVKTRADAALRRAFRLGVPMMIGALLANVGRNIDRIVVAAALGLGLFGQYSFAFMLPLGGMVALAIVAQYVTPQICYAIGAGSTLPAQKRRVDRLVLLLLLAGAVTYPIVLFVIELWGRTFFPQFAEGLELMKVMYIGAVAQILLVYQAIVVAAGNAQSIMRQSVAVAVTATLSSLGAAGLGLGLLSFAWLFVINRLFAGALAYAAARRLSGAREGSGV